MEQTNFIEGQNIYIRPYDKDGIGIYCSRDKKGKRIEARRLFTISRPYSYIQILDENGEELGILKDINSLDKKSQMYLKKTLDKFYVIPKITEINDLYEEYGVSRWDVVTDRGNRVFEVISRNTDIHLLGNGRILIRDADNNRYEIPDYRKLSKKSRKLLEGEI